MHVLTNEQVEKGYFYFADTFERVGAFEVSDYKGGYRLYARCTQLDGLGGRYSPKDRKRILQEWIDAFSTNSLPITALHLNSNIPQRLFDAACCQSELTEFYCKFGKYSDLTPLLKLKKLQFLHLGSCPSVTDISVLAQLKTLKVLFVENFKKIEDYSPLAALDGLEQLIISGSLYETTPIKDLEFLRDMPNLRSIQLMSVKYRKKYTRDELQDLRAAVPQLHDIHGCIWGEDG